MTYCCAETLVSDMRHVSELLVPGFGRPVLLCRDKMPRAREMAAYVRDGFGAMVVFMVYGVRQNLYDP